MLLVIVVVAIVIILTIIFPYILPNRVGSYEKERRKWDIRYHWNKDSVKSKGIDKMDRAEHLQWCKDRALEYVELGDLSQAYTSMSSDLGKHEGTSNHSGIELGMMEMMIGGLNTPEKMRHHIEGYN